MAAKKKTEATDAIEINEQAKIREERIYTLDELFQMKFTDGYGNTVMVRKAYKPRGKLEFYSPEH